MKVVIDDLEKYDWLSEAVKKEIVTAQNDLKVFQVIVMGDELMVELTTEFSECPKCYNTRLEYHHGLVHCECGWEVE